jgi:hypothetical protein
VKVELMRQDYFTWPEQWTLRSCGASGGYREMKLAEYFVGPAGRYLRTNARWKPSWDALGPADRVMVTNIVKFFTRREAGLEGDPHVPDCIRAVLRS